MHPAWYINGGLSVLLQSLLFWRAFLCRLWRRYPLFYAYLSYMALCSLIFGLPAVIRHPLYAKAYWYSYLFAATIRFGIAPEIYRYVFPKNSPLRARAGFVVLSVLTLLALVFWLVGAGPGSPLPDAVRKIALAIAAWILTVLGLSHYYRIRLGLNVWGMAIGLLIFTGNELVNLSAIDLFPRWWAVWRFVNPLVFVFMLLVWTYSLWRYHPNPPTPVLNKALAQEFLSAWRERWMQVPDILRGVAKR